MNMLASFMLETQNRRHYWIRVTLMPQYLTGFKGSMYFVLEVLDVVHDHLGFAFLVNHDPLITIKCGHVLRNSLDSHMGTFQYMKFCTWGTRGHTFLYNFTDNGSLQLQYVIKKYYTFMMYYMRQFIFDVLAHWAPLHRLWYYYLESHIAITI